MSQPLPVHELGDKCDILHKECGNELMIEKLQYLGYCIDVLEYLKAYLAGVSKYKFWTHRDPLLDPMSRVAMPTPP